MSSPNLIKEAYEEIQFEDENQKSSNSPTSFKDIVLASFKKATDAGSSEMTSGGLQKRFVNGQLVEFVVPNQPHIFCNSVDMFRIKMEPKMQEYPKIVEQMAAVDKRLELLNAKKQKMIDDLFQKKNGIGGYKSNQDRAEEYATKAQQMHDIEDYYDDERVKIYRDMLKVLSFLLYEMKYFDEVGAMF